MNYNYSEKNYPKHIIALAVFGLLLLFFISRFYSNSMLHQLCRPILISPEIDNTYWIFHLLQIPEMLTHNIYFAWSFDIIIFSLTVSCLVFRKIFFLPMLLFIFLFAYLLIFNSYAGHHYYFSAGLLFIVLPFATTDNKKFDLLFEAARYYCCFLYASSGLYKLIRGAIFNSEQMSSILMNDNTDKMYYNPHSLSAEVISYLIQRPELSQWLFMATAIIELSFLIGFLTKKFDLILLLGIALFHTGNYVLLGISFIEQVAIFLTLVPKGKWIALNEWATTKIFLKE